MRLLSMTLLTVGRPGGRAEGGLLRRTIVARPPRRSALLLTLFFAFLACVLGFAGARTVLAQEGGASPQPPPQPPEALTKDDEATPPTQPQPPEDHDFQVDCNQTQGVTWSGRGFIPNGTLSLWVQRQSRESKQVFESEDIVYVPLDGTISGRAGDYEPGMELVIDVNYLYTPDPPNTPVWGLTAGTTCPEPQGPVTPSPTTTPEGGTSAPGEGGGSGSGSGGSVITPVGDVFSGLLAGRLPDTGGGWTILLIAGAILIALGWLLVRLARRFAAR